MNKQIGFIGMGVMGAPMAVNLQKAGFSVTVWNRTPDRPGTRFAEQSGCRVAPDIKKCVQDADIVAMCVSRDRDAEQVTLGDGGIVASAKPGTLVIDFSTIGPAASISIGNQVRKAGLHYLEAPVSGGDLGAINATLAIIAGGSKEDFEQARPVFEAVGEHIYHCGELGAGQAVKAANQILCAVHATALAEAYAYAKAHDIDFSKIVEVCSSGAAGSWALSNLGRRVADGDLETGFAVPLMLKDIGIVNHSGLDLPSLAVAEKKFAHADELRPNVATQGIVLAYD